MHDGFGVSGTEGSCLPRVYFYGSISESHGAFNTYSMLAGVFRKACEITMDILRINKDSLMNVLEAYVHDPLVEWEDEKNRRVRSSFPLHSQMLNTDSDPLLLSSLAQARDVRVNALSSKSSRSPSNHQHVPDVRELAAKYLSPVESKLRGLQGRPGVEVDTALTTANHVELLIQMAMDNENLVRPSALVSEDDLLKRMWYLSAGSDVSGLGGVVVIVFVGTCSLAILYIPDHLGNPLAAHAHRPRLNYLYTTWPMYPYNNLKQSCLSHLVP